MDQVEVTFRAASESYRRAEQHLADAESALRKLLARFSVAGMEQHATVVQPPLRRQEPEIWDRVEQLLATRQLGPVEKPEPVTR